MVSQQDGVATLNSELYAPHFHTRALSSKNPGCGLKTSQNRNVLALSSLMVQVTCLQQLNGC